MKTIDLLAASALGAALLLAPALAPAQAASAPAAAEPAVAPGSRQALTRMGGYLRTLKAFEVKADLLTDEVVDGDRTVQFASTTTYKVRAPNGFTIDMVSDRKVRKVFYDGRKVTVSAPRAGYYAQVSAPPTIRETLDVLHDQGVYVPLEDIFQWGATGADSPPLDRGIYVGPARLNGVETDQYAFSSGEVDWQIWIRRGEQPVPVRVVISDETDPAHPRLQANLIWNVAPALADADFVFTPPAGAKTITFAATGGE